MNNIIVANAINNTNTKPINNNNNNNNNHHRISNGTQACAACKYQRRKCAPDCVLAPYFPHDRQVQFLNAHKLFGVSNITKIIRNLKVPDKDIAMHTIMFQSDARAKDPVGGCYRIIRDLHYQIEFCKAELDLVFQQLAICKAQAYQQQQQQQQSQMLHINPQVLVPPLSHPILQGVVEEEGNNNNNNNNNCDNNNNNDDNDNNNNEYYRHYHETLMRCYYEGYGQGGVQYVEENNENDQFSWAPHDDNNSNSHGECFIVKQDFASECDGLPMKLMRLDSGDTSPYDISDHVDVTCGSIHSEELKFGSEPEPATQLREEIVLKENNIIIGN
ncbi:uncharacterized protein LOC141621199 [Silene latifolia]|uniref:uncharacterized protein LOC141621199 n=1 Tax=Silene latifolia TaxID=37657 RepID=UPI003D785029